MKHEITRHRHEAKRRRLTVCAKTRITPNMIRIVLGGEELSSFLSLGVDDHVKLFVPHGEGTAMRDYTPRAFDSDAETLAIEFAVHEAGPATRWAVNAEIGDELEIGGPRGSQVVSPTFDWYLLVGDETALPAIARRCAELPAETRVTTVVAVERAEEEQAFETSASVECLWVHRALEAADDPEPLLGALRALPLPEGDGYVWIAGEAGVAKAIRGHVVGERGHPQQWTKASGYWRRGAADAHEEFQD